MRVAFNFKKFYPRNIRTFFFISNFIWELKVTKYQATLTQIVNGGSFSALFISVTLSWWDPIAQLSLLLPWMVFWNVVLCRPHKNLLLLGEAILGRGALAQAGRCWPGRLQ